MVAIAPAAGGTPTPPARREGALQLLRGPGDPDRGVGLTNVGAGGPPPPTETGATSVAQRMMDSRAAASPYQSHPGALGTAANPPRGRHIDVKA